MGEEIGSIDTGESIGDRSEVVTDERALSRPMRPRRVAAGFGVFAILLGIYIFTTSGRLDSIDGQFRFDASSNWLSTGDPTIGENLVFWGIRDPATGKLYASYNAAASVTPMPLMLLSRAFPGNSANRERFAFSLTGTFFGAGIGVLLFIGFGMLGAGLRMSLACTGVACLATHLWPSSLTVLDQNQHAFFLLAALLLAWESGRRGSLAIAALGGLVGGLVVNYQENYGLLFPMIAVAALAGPNEGREDVGGLRRQKLDWRGLLRYVTFGVFCTVGFALMFAYNYLRYDAAFPPGRFAIFGAEAVHLPHPFVAALSLMVSPGKSFFLYSPPLLLSLVGVRMLFRRAPMLAAAIAITSLVHFLFIIQIPFFGGDWCWGPRYLLVLVPFWSLALPYAFEALDKRRHLAVAVVALGFVVQFLGVSLDFHRFYFERNYSTYFWNDDEWIWFEESPLIARAFEVYTTARDGIPDSATQFAPVPEGEVTFTPGAFDHRISRQWMRFFKIWYVPFAWPFWFSYVAPEYRPVDQTLFLILCAVLVIGGAALVVRACRAGPTT